MFVLFMATGRLAFAVLLVALGTELIQEIAYKEDVQKILCDQFLVRHQFVSFTVNGLSDLAALLVVQE